MTKKEKCIGAIVAIVLMLSTNSLSYFAGRNYIYMAADGRKDGTTTIMYPHYFNIKEAMLNDRQLIVALFDGLHRFYSNDDNDAWFEEFAQTKEYAKIDSLLQGDWEDFYYYETPQLENWYAVYGTEFEPSKAYKDSVNFGIAKALPCP